MSIATVHSTTQPTDAALLPSLIGRTFAEWPTKLLMLVTLPALFLAGYVAVQRLTPFESTPVPATPVDRLLAFDALWVWPYVSLYAFLPLGPAMSVRRRQLARYTIGLSVMAVVSFIVFYFVPTTAPRLHLSADPPSNWAYDLVILLDMDRNACPSLHAGLVAYSMLFAWRVLRDRPAAHRRLTTLVVTVGLAWSVVILLGTLGTKQHRFIDLVGGFAVAMLGHVVAWSWLAPEPADLTTRKDSP